MSMFLLAIILIAQSAGLGEKPKIPVSIDHKGDDSVGILFESALKQEISVSSRYRLLQDAKDNHELRFYVQILTDDRAEAKSTAGKSSSVSIVIEAMGFPNSYPVPDMWYHKLISVNRRDVPRMAKLFLEDMEASWCNEIKDSALGCPKQKFH
jgi:hypothetical protein